DTAASHPGRKRQANRRHCGCPCRSFLAENQINDPAAPHMFCWLAAVVQNVGVGAACLFESIGKNGHSVKGFFIIDGLSESGHVGCQPGSIDGDRTEGVAEDVTDQGAFAWYIRPTVSHTVSVITSALASP